MTIDRLEHFDTHSEEPTDLMDGYASLREPGCTGMSKGVGHDFIPQAA
jgi:hypothetical protein